MALSGQSISVDGHTYTFTGWFGHAALNDNDEVAFVAEFVDDITGIRKPGVWLSSGGSLRLIADVIDGLPAIVPGGNIDSVAGVAINSRGQIAFQTLHGIWATDRYGVVQPIAQIGGTVDLDDGPGENLQTIHSLDVSLNDRQSGRVNGFNDRGEVAFSARFADFYLYDAVFVSSAVAIPEPLSSVQIILILIAIATKRPRRQHSL